MTATQQRRFLNVLMKHFGRRKDLYHVVTGPKRETWFTAEAIAALSKLESGNMNRGFVICGEDSYKTVLSVFNTIPVAPQKGDLSKIPDIVGYSYNRLSVAFIVEAKLINEPDDKEAIKILVELRGQMERARRLLPTTTVIGLVFGVHKLGKPALPETFYKWLQRHITSIFAQNAFQWIEPQQKIIPVPGAQHLNPLGGKWSGQISLGIAPFLIL